MKRYAILTGLLAGALALSLAGCSPPGPAPHRPMPGDLFRRPGAGEIGRRDDRGDNRPFDAGGRNTV